MAQRRIPTALPRDPRDVPVQVNFRMTYRRRLELDELANRFGLTIGDVINDALDRVHPPKGSTKVDA